jgi:methionyl aminopeptidase
MQQRARFCLTSYTYLPTSRPLEDGDLVNVDVTVFLNGYHGDTSQTFLVGDVVSVNSDRSYVALWFIFWKDERGRELVQVTNQALNFAIAACGPGKHFKDIGKIIHSLLRDINYSVSPQFTGHGIGKMFHSAPWIHHHCICLSPQLKNTI